MKLLPGVTQRLGLSVLGVLATLTYFYQGRQLMTSAQHKLHVLIQGSDDKAITSARVFIRRQQRVKDVCASTATVPGQVHGVFTSEMSGVIYCFVPKTGCTFWKRVFNFINNETMRRVYPTVIDIPRHLVHNLAMSSGQRYGAHFSADRYPVRFMVIRDPLTRLLSTYMDKFYLPDLWSEQGVPMSRWVFEKRQRDDHLRRSKSEILGSRSNYGINMTKKAVSSFDPLRKHFDDIATQFEQPSFDSTQNSSASLLHCGKYLTFSEFIEVSEEIWEPHWLPLHEICNPCVFQPTHIIKMESFSVDARSILTALGMPHLLENFSPRAQVNEELQMLVDYHFTRAFHSKLSSHFYSLCLSPAELAIRLWNNFRWRGYIHPGVNLTASSSADERKVKADLMTQIWAARELGLREPERMARAKSEFFQARYSSLSNKLLNGIMKRFLIDFKLFGHEDALHTIIGFLH